MHGKLKVVQNRHLISKLYRLILPYKFLILYLIHTNIHMVQGLPYSCALKYYLFFWMCEKKAIMPLSVVT